MFVGHMLHVDVQIVIQSSLLSKQIEGHAKSILLIRGTHYQYWLT